MNRSVDDQAARTPAVAGVPLLDLARQHGPLQAEFAAALAKVCQSGWFCLGPEVKQLEESLARYSGVKHAIGCASGSDALLLALMALEIGPGDEVIVPSFTFFATASARRRSGARPVFADIDPATFNIDPTKCPWPADRQDRAIIPVHLYGQCAEMDALLEVSRATGVPLIEDAAQAIDARIRRAPVRAR